MSETIDVLKSIDQLRRDLSGYHGQLTAHNDLQRHCDNQRARITELEGLYAEKKAENAELKRKLGILGEYGIEVVDAVAGGFEIYSEDHRLADALKAENDKLRELAKDMWRLLHHWLFEAKEVPYGEIKAVSDRMRELGVEVQR